MVEERRKARLDIYAETQRRIVELSDALRACRGSAQGEVQSIVQVDVPKDGATRGRVLGTSLSECAAVRCIRDKLTALQVASPPLADTRSFQWLLAMNDQGPVRLEPANPNHAFFGASPASSAACLDEVPKASDVSGRLPPEVVREIVRGNFEAYRKCYEAGLGRHRDLEGKVTLRFVIERDGTVSKVSLNDNTLPDCAVARCIEDGFKTLRFPKPEGGIVTVTYPIMLEKGEAD
jgi:hypothetical protein